VKKKERRRRRRRKRRWRGGRGRGCHARKANTTSNFYPRGHAVASVKIKTFTGKSFGSHAERREFFYERAAVLAVRGK